jgi:hypothetical protein
MSHSGEIVEEGALANNRQLKNRVTEKLLSFQEIDSPQKGERDI